MHIMLALGLIGLISWVIFGLIAGVIAKAIMPGNDPGGFIVTALLGIAGAIIGGFVAESLLGFAEPNGQWSLRGFIFAVIGAIILLAIYRLIAGRRT